jgi:hypothetical protein
MAVGHTCNVEVNLGSCFFLRKSTFKSDFSRFKFQTFLHFFSVCNQVLKSFLLHLINFSAATGNCQANGSVGQLLLFLVRFVTLFPETI